MNGSSEGAMNGGLFEGGEEGAGREGRAERGQRVGAKVGTTKGRHLPGGGKGRPWGEGGEANYS